LLALALASPAWARPDQPVGGELWHYDPADLVESWPSAGGHFRVHFCREGKHAVPAADANADGTPDFVQELADLYEQVLAFYTGLGYRAPLKDAGAGGDDRFDVYLLDFAKKADGSFVRESCSGDTCSGYMVQENDFAGYGYPSLTYANRVLSSHEFFHAVQAAYDSEQSSIIGEGTAVWATEQFDASLNDFEGFLPGYFKRPDRSLDKPIAGPVDEFSYGMAIWFRFLSERFGPDIVRQLWSDCENGQHGVANPQWFPTLAKLLERDHPTTFAAELQTFAAWNLRTGKYAGPGGYQQAKSYPQVLATKGDLPYVDTDLRLFYAATQYVRVNPDGRPEMTAVVLPDKASAELRLWLATRTGATLSTPVALPTDPTQPLQMVATANADEVIVWAVHTGLAGDSIKGTLCIGAADEVEDCRPSTQPPRTVDASSAEVGANRSTAEVQTSAKGPSATTASPGAATGGCTAVHGGQGGAAWPLVLLAVVLVGRRRWRCVA
jgi:hypothetical protein